MDVLQSVRRLLRLGPREIAEPAALPATVSSPPASPEERMDLFVRRAMGLIEELAMLNVQQSRVLDETRRENRRLAWKVEDVSQELGRLRRALRPARAPRPVLPPSTLAGDERSWLAELWLSLVAPQALRQNRERSFGHSRSS